MNPRRNESKKLIIQISRDTEARLKAEGQFHDTWDDILTRILDEWQQCKKQKKQ